jgi:hypothetical protein
MEDLVTVTRDYDVTLPDGSRGKLMFALGDMSRDNAFSRHARSIEALAFGLLSFAGIAGAPAHPMLWAQTRSELVMTLHEADQPFGLELQQLVGRTLGTFFEDIQDEAPEVAGLKLYPRIGGSTALN